MRYWQDWLIAAYRDVPMQAPSGVLLNAGQVRLLWERCVDAEIRDPLLNRGLFARQVRDCRERIAEWRVGIDACEAAARTRDHHVFVRIVRAYTQALANGGWLDRSQLIELARLSIGEGKIEVPDRVMLAGFDRLTPSVAQFRDALVSAGATVDRVGAALPPEQAAMHVFETPEAELRAAGAWVRGRLDAEPEQRVGIVVPGLESRAAEFARYVREGLVPGWQWGPASTEMTVNVVLGRTLGDYPAVRIACLLLGWLARDLPAPDVGMLLTSPLLGAGTLDARSRLERRLRLRPTQSWDPGRLAGLLADREEEGAEPFVEALRGLAEVRKGMPQRAAPRDWARTFADCLDLFGWPGNPALGSDAFQLVNRWRELLNEFSQLQRVIESLSIADACRRIEVLARDTLFQPETEDAAVQLLSPAEAAGLEFDALWVAGFTAANWPPPARPLALVSRDLQRKRGMPDADPDETLSHSRKIFDRLSSSARDIVLSYARHDGDAEQTISAMAAGLDLPLTRGPSDPGWAAADLSGSLKMSLVADRVPPVFGNEVVEGGAMTVARQMSEPFAAFVHGRLGLRSLPSYRAGLQPAFRGNLVHDVLQHLYAPLPGRAELASWATTDLDGRIRAALDTACRRFERLADPLLARFLALEKDRIAPLAREVVRRDCEREDFRVVAVEEELDATLEGIRLRLRMDRVDRLPDERAVIFDYKTGRPRRLLDRQGQPVEMQLIVYACAYGGGIAGLGLWNIDSRSVALEYAGGEDDWSSDLERWKGDVRAALLDLAKGDVRINRWQGPTAARRLAILSRYAELLRVG